MKKLASAMVVALAAASVWKAVYGAVPEPVVHPKIAAHVAAHEITPVRREVRKKAAPKHVAAVRRKPAKLPVSEGRTDVAIKMVPIDRLLKESSTRSSARPEAARDGAHKPDKVTEDDVGLDIGRGLPLPTPESILFTPIDKPDGFHVGVEYHVDQKWDLTGLAGVTTNGNALGVTSPGKPSVNQVGLKANYRF